MWILLGSVKMARCILPWHLPAKVKKINCGKGRFCPICMFSQRQCFARIGGTNRKPFQKRKNLERSWKDSNIARVICIPYFTTSSSDLFKFQSSRRIETRQRWFIFEIYLKVAEFAYLLAGRVPMPPGRPPNSVLIRWLQFFGLVHFMFILIRLWYN